MHVGGRVEWLLEPAHPEELLAAWCAARERGSMPRILGGGANLILAGDVPGVVIGTERMRYVFRPEAGSEPERAFLAEPPLAAGGGTARQEDEGAAERAAPRLVAWCGATLPSLVRTAADLGWSGLEALAGVPGQLGGGVRMNAGGRFGDMWDVVESVRVIDADGRLLDLERSACHPSYRDGGLGGAVVVGAVLRFERSTRALVRERVREYLLEKRRVQPVTEWSAGCIFKNPDPAASGGRSAGRLIEESGGKELARGDAVVSPVHANFIVNRGAATAADVLALIEDVRDRVADRTGIALETEVEIWR
jgi:UDP-N-acetylmuramate dehydrogenase